MGRAISPSGPMLRRVGEGVMGGEGVEPPFTARYCLYALLNPCPHMCLPACLPAHLPACCRVPAGSGGPATACYSLPTSLPALLPTCLPAHLPACCTVPAGSGGSVLLQPAPACPPACLLHRACRVWWFRAAAGAPGQGPALRPRARPGPVLQLRLQHPHLALRVGGGHVHTDMAAHGEGRTV